MTTSSAVRMRRATAGDGPALQDLERRAGVRFTEVGMPDIAADDPTPLDALAGYAADEIGPGLAALVSEEAAHGLDPATRVCMRRPVA